MEQQKVLKEIRDFLADNFYQQQVDKYSRYFKEGYDSYGVAKDKYKELYKAILEKYISGSTLEEVLPLSGKLVASGKYEEASLAIGFIGAIRKELQKSLRKKRGEQEVNGRSMLKFDREVFAELRSWFDEGITNWAHTDIICSELTGKFLIDDNISLHDFASWRKSGSKWTRRAVPVSMLSLLKRGDKIQPLLDFIEPMMQDEERPVGQGLGWFLRETWIREPEKVESFLLKWKEVAPRIIYQYATEKMDKEHRLNFRRKKSKKNLLNK